MFPTTPAAAHSSLSHLVTLSPLKKRFTSRQHKSLLDFQLRKMLSLSAFMFPTFWKHRRLLFIFFPPCQPLLLHALESKYNKFQHIARAGVLCYFSAQRVSTIETQLWWSVQAPRESLEGPEHMFVNDHLQRRTMGAACHWALYSFATSNRLNGRTFCWMFKPRMCLPGLIAVESTL